MSLSEKLVGNSQRRNLDKIIQKIKNTRVENAMLGQIYYPHSSRLLKLILDKIREGAWPKLSFTSPFEECEIQLNENLALYASSEKVMLCFFSNYTYQVETVTSDLPVLEVSAESVGEWFKVAKGEGINFFLCCSKDLKKGVALDVYEADPVIHNTSGAVLDLYAWND